MKARTIRARQRGVALAAALILLTVLTLISIFVASTAGLELHMAKNMQDSFNSLQSAEGGVTALVRLVRGGPDPFTREDKSNPFQGVSPSPLSELNDGAASVNVNVVFMLEGASCPRSTHGYSVDLVSCDHYRIESRHSGPNARTKVDQGMVKPVIGSASP